MNSLCPCCGEPCKHYRGYDGNPYEPPEPETWDCDHCGEVMDGLECETHERIVNTNTGA